MPEMAPVTERTLRYYGRPDQNGLYGHYLYERVSRLGNTYSLDTHTMCVSGLGPAGNQLMDTTFHRGRLHWMGRPNREQWMRFFGAAESSLLWNAVMNLPADFQPTPTTINQPQGDNTMPTTTTQPRDAHGRFTSLVQPTPIDTDDMSSLIVADTEITTEEVQHCTYCGVDRPSSWSYGEWMRLPRNAYIPRLAPYPNSGVACEDCYWEHFFRCESCEDVFSSDESCYDEDSGEQLCGECYSGRMADRDDDREPYGQWNYTARGMVGGYRSTPPIEFYDYVDSEWLHPRNLLTASDDPRLYMGVELEVELKGARSAEDVFNTILDDRKDFLALKSDGSLRNGVEIVSQPMTMAAWRAFDLTWMDKIARMGVRSWDTTTCGLHVHVSMSAFKSRSHFARWWMLHEKNSASFIKLAGRHSRDYARWTGSEVQGAAVRRAYAFKPYDPLESPFAPPAPNWNSRDQRRADEMEFARNMFVKYHPNKLARQGEINSERYVALNMAQNYGRHDTNTWTVEQRFWRPSLRYGTMLAALESIQATFDYTAELSNLNTKEKALKDGGAFSWDVFRGWVLAHSSKYPYLNDRIDRRFGTSPDADDDQ